MASRTPSRSSRRKTKSRATSRRTRRTPAKTTARRPAKSEASQPPAEITPALRSQFEKLGARWKNLLPRLTQSAGRNGHGTSPRRRRAPKSRAAGRSR